MQKMLNITNTKISGFTVVTEFIFMAHKRDETTRDRCSSVNFVVAWTKSAQFVNILLQFCNLYHILQPAHV